MRVGLRAKETLAITLLTFLVVATTSLIYFSQLTRVTVLEASRQAERALILQVLTGVRWNRKRAAQELQISYKALLYKLKQMGLDGSATP